RRLVSPWVSFVPFVSFVSSWQICFSHAEVREPAAQEWRRARVLRSRPGGVVCLSRRTRGNLISRDPRVTRLLAGRADRGPLSLVVSVRHPGSATFDPALRSHPLETT